MLPLLYATIECLRQVFAQFGVAEIVVTDNGTCFASSDFQSFLPKRMEFVISRERLTTQAASIALAEHAVNIVHGLKKVTQGTLDTRLAKELLLNWRPRYKLDLVRPKVGR